MNTLLSTSTIRNTTVENRPGESLGSVKDIMLHPDSGRVEYAVLDFGGFLGIGDKLFAVPLQAFEVDRNNERFVLDVTKDRLKEAPGFDKDNWPETANREFSEGVYDFYGHRDTYLRTRVNEPAMAN
jgi:sporulation protein YlmC with PRC-barrel domain